MSKTIQENDKPNSKQNMEEYYQNGWLDEQQMFENLVSTQYCSIINPIEDIYTSMGEVNSRYRKADADHESSEKFTKAFLGTFFEFDPLTIKELSRHTLAKIKKDLDLGKRCFIPVVVPITDGQGHKSQHWNLLEFQMNADQSISYMRHDVAADGRCGNHVKTLIEKLKVINSLPPKDRAKKISECDPDGQSLQDVCGWNVSIKNFTSEQSKNFLTNTDFKKSIITDTSLTPMTIESYERKLSQSMPVANKPSLERVRPTSSSNVSEAKKHAVQQRSKSPEIFTAPQSKQRVSPLEGNVFAATHTIFEQLKTIHNASKRDKQKFSDAVVALHAKLAAQGLDTYIFKLQFVDKFRVWIGEEATKKLCQLLQPAVQVAHNSSTPVKPTQSI